jgi:hypothetical protein
MRHVDARKSGEKEKRKRGHKPEKNPQKYRYMVRLNEAKNKWLLSMYGQSGLRVSLVLSLIVY